MQIKVVHTGEIHNLNAENIVSINELKHEIQQVCSVNEKNQLLLNIDGNEVVSVPKDKDASLLVLATNLDASQLHKPTLPDIEVPSIEEKLRQLNTDSCSGEFSQRMRELEEYLSQIQLYTSLMKEMNVVCQFLRQKSQNIRDILEILHQFRNFVSAKAMKGIGIQSKNFIEEFKKKEKVLLSIADTLEQMSKMKAHKALTDDKHQVLTDFFDKKSYITKLHNATKTISNIQKQFDDTKNKFEMIQNKDIEISFENYLQEIIQLSGEAQVILECQESKLRDCQDTNDSLRPLVEELDKSGDFSERAEMSVQFMQIPDCMSMNLATTMQNADEMKKIAIHIVDLHNKLMSIFANETTQVSKFGQQSQVVVQSLSVLCDLLCSNKYLSDVFVVLDFMGNYEEGKKEVMRRREFKKNLKPENTLEYLSTMCDRENIMRREFAERYPYASVFIPGLDDEALVESDFDTRLPDIDDIIDMNWILESQYYGAQKCNTPLENSNNSDDENADGNAIITDNDVKLDQIDTTFSTLDNQGYKLLINSSCSSINNDNNNVNTDNSALLASTNNSEGSNYKSIDTFTSDSSEDFDESQSADFSSDNQSDISDDSFEVVERFTEHKETETLLTLHKIEFYEQRLKELIDENEDLMGENSKRSSLLTRLESNLTALEQQLTDQVLESENLNCQVHELQQCKASLSAKIEEMMLMLEQTQKQLEGKTESNKQLQSDLHYLMDQIETLTASLQSVNAERDQLLDDLTQGRMEHQEEKDQYEDKINQLSQSILELQQEKDVVHNLLDAHQQDLETLRGDHASIFNNFSDLESAYSDIKVLKEKLHAEVGDLKEQLRVTKSENEHLADEVDHLLALQSETEQKLNDEVKRMELLIEELQCENTKNREYYEDVSTVLEGRVRALTEENIKLGCDVDNLKDELDQATTKISNHLQIHSQLLVCLSEANEKNNQFQQQIDELETHKESSEAKMQQQAELIEDLQSRCRDFEYECEKLEAQVEDDGMASSQKLEEIAKKCKQLSAELEQAVHIQTALETENVDLRSQIDTMKASMATIAHKYSGLQHKLMEVEKFYEQKCHDLVAREKCLRDLENKNKEKDATIQSMHEMHQHHASVWETRMQELENEHATVKQQFEDHKVHEATNSSDMQKMIADLEYCLADAQAEKQKRAESVSELSHKIEEYEEEIEGLQDQVSALVDTNNHMGVQNEKLEEKLSSIIESKRQLEANLVSSTKQVDLLTEKNAQLEEVVAKYEADIKKHRFEISSLNDILSVSQDAVDKKSQDVRTLEEKLMKYSAHINDLDMEMEALKSSAELKEKSLLQQYNKEIDMLEARIKQDAEAMKKMELEKEQLIETQRATMDRTIEEVTALKMEMDKLRAEAKQSQPQQQQQDVDALQRSLRFAKLESQASKEILKNVKELLRVNTIDQIVSEIDKLRHSAKNNAKPQQFALKELKKGDVAMFSTSPSNGNYQAVLHPSSQPCFLKLESLQSIGYRVWVEAKVESVQMFRAQPNNMYGLPVNTVYYEVLAEPLAYGDAI